MRKWFPYAAVFAIFTSLWVYFSDITMPSSCPPVKDAAMAIMKQKHQGFLATAVAMKFFALAIFSDPAGNWTVLLITTQMRGCIIFEGTYLQFVFPQNLMYAPGTAPKRETQM